MTPRAAWLSIQEEIDDDSEKLWEILDEGFEKESAELYPRCEFCGHLLDEHESGEGYSCDLCDCDDYA